MTGALNDNSLWYSPLPPFLPPRPASQHQILQRVDRMRDLYELEAVLELSRVKPDINNLQIARPGIELPA